jgi:CBS domain-containing protein
MSSKQPTLIRKTQPKQETFMKVRDVMSPDVQLCTPDDTLKDAAEAMAALAVGLLPVTDNECLVGMISDRDIAIRGVALGRGPDSRVGDVMTAEVKYCYDDQELDEVAANMGDIQIRRLPVLNRDKRLVGIVTLGDIAQAQPGNGTAEALRRISRPGGQHAQL